MEDQMMLHSTNEEVTTPPTTSNINEVYVDDFCCGKNNLDPTNLRHTSRALLHGIHTIFPPTTITKLSNFISHAMKKVEALFMWCTIYKIT